MKPSREDEYQRFLGFPSYLWPQREPGKGWFHRAGEGSRSSFLVLWHPITWVRWRISVRRQGPYAPDFEEFLRGRSPDSSRRPL